EGSYEIVAFYSGDTGFDPSESDVHTHNVEQVHTTTQAFSSGTPSFVGDTVTLYASVSSSINRIPEGSVEIFLDDVSLGTFVLDSSGQASVETEPLTSGDHTFRATYAGTNVFAPSESEA